MSTVFTDSQKTLAIDIPVQFIKAPTSVVSPKSNMHFTVIRTASDIFTKSVNDKFGLYTKADSRCYNKDLINDSKMEIKKTINSTMSGEVLFVGPKGSSTTTVSNVLKVMKYNEEEHKEVTKKGIIVDNILSEVVISLLASELVINNVCPNFVLFDKLFVCNDKESNKSLQLFSQYVQGEAISSKSVTLALTQAKEMYDFLFQMVMNLAILQKYFNVSHHDLHMGNVLMWQYTSESGSSSIEYIYNNKKLYNWVTGKRYIVIDFGLAQIPGKIEPENYQEYYKKDWNKPRQTCDIRRLVLSTLADLFEKAMRLMQDKYEILEPNFEAFVEAGKLYTRAKADIKYKTVEGKLVKALKTIHKKFWDYPEDIQYKIQFIYDRQCYRIIKGILKQKDLEALMDYMTKSSNGRIAESYNADKPLALHNSNLSHFIKNKKLYDNVNTRQERIPMKYYDVQDPRSPSSPSKYIIDTLKRQAAPRQRKAL